GAALQGLAAPALDLLERLHPLGDGVLLIGVGFEPPPLLLVEVLLVELPRLLLGVGEVLLVDPEIRLARPGVPDAVLLLILDPGVIQRLLPPLLELPILLLVVLVLLLLILVLLLLTLHPLLDPFPMVLAFLLLLLHRLVVRLCGLLVLLDLLRGQREVAGE